MRDDVDPIALRYPGFGPAARRNAETLIELALAEDLGTSMPGLRLNPQAGAIELDFTEWSGVVGDLTAESTIPQNALGAAHFVARSPGVIAGLPVLELLAARFGLQSWFRPLVADGDRVEAGAAVAYVAGAMRETLMMERTALNFLQRLSGIATLTRRFVDAVAGTRAEILDTRKTTPGWRALEKYAVRCGGGRNHRFGLYDAVLIKDNHLAWIDFLNRNDSAGAATLGQADAIGAAISSARVHTPAGTVVEVEVDSLGQLDRALECGPDIILVDNFGPDELAEAVRRRDARAPGVLLEASGGITLATVGAVARAGVDRISVGALTHSAPALDIGLDFERSLPS
jgi:nicotinate-nucleotide pyrophosphorylase (carboxylating)